MLARRRAVGGLEDALWYYLQHCKRACDIIRLFVRDDRTTEPYVAVVAVRLSNSWHLEYLDGRASEECLDGHASCPVGGGSATGAVAARRLGGWRLGSWWRLGGWRLGSWWRLGGSAAGGSAAGGSGMARAAGGRVATIGAAVVGARRLIYKWDARVRGASAAPEAQEVLQ